MGEHVMVFAPVPQLTVTVEQVGDRPELHLHAGGQGLWQARMIASLGVPVTFCAVLGGEVGGALKPLIESEGLRLRAVERQFGNGWYIHDRRGGVRTVVAEDSGELLGRHELDELYALALAEGLDATMSVLSGPAQPSVVPADIYARLSTDLSENGASIAADLSGDHLSAVLAGRPTFIKVSDEELVANGRLKPDSDGGRDGGAVGRVDGAVDVGAVGGVIEAMWELRDEGAGTVVVSRADRPALALVDDQVLEVRMPRLSVRDHHGAGDSMTAGVVSVLARGGDLRTAIRTGAAAGALNVTRHGLGTGNPEAILKLVEHVQLEEIS
jgi:1-phosphofructokinase